MTAASSVGAHTGTADPQVRASEGGHRSRRCHRGGDRQRRCARQAGAVAQTYCGIDEYRRRRGRPNRRVADQRIRRRSAVGCRRSHHGQVFDRSNNSTPFKAGHARPTPLRDAVKTLSSGVKKVVDKVSDNIKKAMTAGSEATSKLDRRLTAVRDHRLGPVDVSFVAKRSRHVAVAAHQVRVRVVAAGSG